jgi:acetolactate synthase regulatory subunit
MSRRLQIELDTSEGALLRVLGTVERRGFALLDLRAGKPDEQRYLLQLTLDGARDAEVLCRQLERLVDVRTVRLLAEAELATEPTDAGFHATWLQ